MKRLSALAISLFVLIAASAQTVSKELSSIKPGSKIAFVCDFSQAVIMGMDEEGFGQYEPDWASDKPTVVVNFMNGINSKLDGVLVIGQLKDCEYTLNVTVRNVTTKGYITCDAEITDTTGVKYFSVKQVNGGKEPPFSPGTKLAKMKVWASLTGKSLGSIIRSEYLGQ